MGDWVYKNGFWVDKKTVKNTKEDNKRGQKRTKKENQLPKDNTVLSPLTKVSVGNHSPNRKMPTLDTSKQNITVLSPLSKVSVENHSLTKSRPISQISENQNRKEALPVFSQEDEDSVINHSKIQSKDNSEGLDIEVDKSSEITYGSRDIRLKCRVCDIQVTSKVDLEKHMLGKKHKQILESQKKLRLIWG